MDENEPTPSNKKILMIDDDLAFLELYGTVFNSAGFNFSVAKNGIEALEKAKLEKPDLILLDIMLPDINGLEVLKRLKRDPETSVLGRKVYFGLLELYSKSLKNEKDILLA